MIEEMTEFPPVFLRLEPTHGLNRSADRMARKDFTMELRKLFNRTRRGEKFALYACAGHARVMCPARWGKFELHVYYYVGTPERKSPNVVGWGAYSHYDNLEAHATFLNQLLEDLPWVRGVIWKVVEFYITKQELIRDHD